LAQQQLRSRRDYIFKLDDDVYVVRNLTSLIEESNNKQCVSEGPQPMISLGIFYALLEKYQLLLAQIPQTTSSSSKPTTLAVEATVDDDVIEGKFIRGHAIDDEKVNNDGLIINNEKKLLKMTEDSRQN
jgi:hypothetical protein